MSESKTVYVKGGTNLFGLLGIVLVIAKLAEIDPVTNWSWWLVTMPFWLGLAIAFGFLFLFFGLPIIVLGLAWCVAAVWDWIEGIARRRARAKATAEKAKSR